MVYFPAALANAILRHNTVRLPLKRLAFCDTSRYLFGTRRYIIDFRIKSLSGPGVGVLGPKLKF